MTTAKEKWSKRIAEFICEKRKTKPVETTFELVEIIKAAIPKKARMEGGHPAKRVFQAIRIEVNNELGILGNAIKGFVSSIKSGGRLAIITFHSLEDRIVKKTFRIWQGVALVRKNFRYAYAVRNRKLKLFQENRFYRRKKSLNIIHVQKVQN